MADMLALSRTLGGGCRESQEIAQAQTDAGKVGKMSRERNFLRRDFSASKNKKITLFVILP